VYLLLGAPIGGWPLIVVSLILYGLFYAGTDGVLMALVAPVLPASVRATGMALVQTAQALAYLVSSVLFGLAWQVFGPQPAVRIAAVAAVVAASATAMLAGRRSSTVDEPDPVSRHADPVASPGRELVTPGDPDRSATAGSEDLDRSATAGSGDSDRSAAAGG
jgi:MFS family permease